MRHWRSYGSRAGARQASSIFTEKDKSNRSRRASAALNPADRLRGYTGLLTHRAGAKARMGRGRSGQCPKLRLLLRHRHLVRPGVAKADWRQHFVVAIEARNAGTAQGHQVQGAIVAQAFFPHVHMLYGAHQQ